MNLIGIKVTGVCERDIDLLLLEEFIASHNFLVWFLNEIRVHAPGRLVSAARSVTTSNGESDLELTISDEHRITKILIENKVDAILQPRQDERYFERASDYLKAGVCHAVVTVLVAPQEYSESSLKFDKKITYEAILEWIRCHLNEDPRGHYKCHLLNEAIERGGEGWHLVPDPVRTEFWKKYWKLTIG